MIKKILTVGCSGGTSMTCCHTDAQNMFDLHCTIKYRKYWSTNPQLFAGKKIIKPVLSIADFYNIMGYFADADVLHISWSSHGTRVKIKGKWYFAFYIGNNSVILYQDFLENFLLPLYIAKPKFINCVLDACEVGTAKRKINGHELLTYDDNLSVENKPEEKYVELKSPKIIKIGKSIEGKQLPKHMRLQLATTKKQPALGDFNGNCFNGFMPNTHGMSLYTACYISAVCNGMQWATGYGKDSWEYVNKDLNKVMRSLIQGLGTKGWLDSEPRTPRQQGTVKVGRKANKEII